jgi:hypothetical protein
MIERICMPALIYLVFSMTHVIIDTYKGLYNTAIIEFWLSAVFTVLLNLLCTHDMSIIAWLIISIPFLLMTVIAGFLLFSFKLNPATGQSLSPQNNNVAYKKPVPTTSATKNSPAPSMHAYPIDVFYESSFLSSK